MNGVFLTARVIHIAAAALWFGTVVFISRLLMPVLQQAGPEGGKIMAGLERHGLVVFISSVGGTTVLTGLFLYWHLTGGFDPARAGMLDAKVFGAGGVLGLAAMIIGGAVVGRSAKKMSALSEKLASMPEKDRAATVAEIQQLRQRVVTFGNIVIALLAVTLALMAIGHYV